MPLFSSSSNHTHAHEPTTATMMDDTTSPTTGHNLLQKSPPNANTIGRNGTVTSTMTVPNKKHSIFSSKRRAAAVDDEASTRAAMGSGPASRANRLDETDNWTHGDGQTLRRGRSSESFSSDLSDSRAARGYPTTNSMMADGHTTTAGYGHGHGYSAGAGAIPPAVPNKDTNLATHGFANDSDGRVTIEQAQTKLKLAVDAENAADEALELSRRHVREAKELIARLEHEANEDTERAHTKSALVAEISNSLKGLGRHG